MSLADELLADLEGGDEELMEEMEAAGIDPNTGEPEGKDDDDIEEVTEQVGFYTFWDCH